MGPIKEEWTSADGQHRILWGDCIEILPTLDTSEVAAVLADPPYGIAFAHGGGGGCLAESTRFAQEAIAGDGADFDPSPWLAFPSVVLWGANHYADKLPPCARWLVWDKRDGMKSNDQADCELAWTNAPNPARLFSHKWNGMIRDGEEAMVPRCHPMQKPVRLMRWCLSFLPPGMVLDPFAGSCTVAVACARTGRRSISIEIEERYFRIGIERMEREAARTPLFESQLRQAELPL
jgi:site-specific DNA-methyltransferase (adenine-specific)/modification methylase